MCCFFIYLFPIYPMNFCLNGRANRPDDVCLLDDLRAFSLVCGGRSFSYGEYKLAGRFYPSIFVRRFGSWNRALVAAGLQPKRLFNVGADVLLENLRRLWVALGRQPTMADLVRPLSGFGRKPYVRVFGSWSEALRSASLESGATERRAGLVSAGTGYCGQHHLPLAALGYSSSSEEESGCLVPRAGAGAVLECGATERRAGSVSVRAGVGNKGAGVPPSHKATADKKRSVGWRVRHLVMKRDGFRCVMCGASPAVTVGVVLHVDHIFPESRGGDCSIDNLQTLCEVCNVGKGNLIG